MLFRSIDTYTVFRTQEKNNKKVFCCSTSNQKYFKSKMLNRKKLYKNSNKQVYSYIGATWGSLLGATSLQCWYISQTIQSTAEVATIFLNHLN